MSKLTQLNGFSKAANMIHSRKLSELTKNRFKYLFLEGMIKFLKMYAVNELGSDCDLDLYRIAMYVNSTRFENEDVYGIKSLDDIYYILTEEILIGVPIWRFIKLSQSQLNILESEYSDNLNKLKEILEKEKSCRMCYFYSSHDTPFGSIERCGYEEPGKWRSYRDREFDSFKVKDCKFFSRTEPEFEDSYMKYRCSGSVKEIKLDELDFYKVTNRDIEEFNSDLEKSKSMDVIDLSIASIGRMLGGKKGYDDINRDSIRASQFSTLYQFMEVHLLIEYGNAFEPNVSRIAKDIYENKFDKFKTEGSFIKYIEDSLIKDPRWVTKYSKKVKI